MMLAARALSAVAPLMLSTPRSLRVEGPEPDRIRVPTRHGEVACLIYRPLLAAPGRPVYVNFHGGAFIVRRPGQDDDACRFLAARTGAVVASVDYDTAPRVRYPVAEEQAYDVAVYMRQRSGGRLAVGGFSAGGKLAINVCQQARDHGTAMPVALVAAYPAVDMTLGLDERTSPAKHPAVAPWLIRLMYGTYFADAGRRAEPLASPAHDPDLAGFPPTMILTGALDTVAAEAGRFAGDLASAGVAVAHHRFPGVDHGFTHDEPAEVARRALALIANHLAAAGV